MRPISKKRSAALKEYAKAKKEFVVEWSNKRTNTVACHRCLKHVPTKKITIHHMRGRVGSLLCDTRYFALLCLTCHQWVGDNPSKARDAGLLCEKGLWNTPDKTA